MTRLRPAARSRFFAPTLAACVASILTVYLIAGNTAVAQSGADCQILWKAENSYRDLATEVTAHVARGYQASGFTAEGAFLYALVCRRERLPAEHFIPAMRQAHATQPRGTRDTSIAVADPWLQSPGP